MVLTRLQWDTAAIVATDYFDHLMSHLSLDVEHQSKIFVQIRRHASIFASLLLTGKLQITSNVSLVSPLTEYMMTYDQAEYQLCIRLHNSDQDFPVYVF